MTALSPTVQGPSSVQPEPSQTPSPMTMSQPSVRSASRRRKPCRCTSWLPASMLTRDPAKVFSPMVIEPELVLKKQAFTEADGAMCSLSALPHSVAWVLSSWFRSISRSPLAHMRSTTRSR